VNLGLGGFNVRVPTSTCENDPVHLGLVIIFFNLMIGPITPPAGLSLFMVSNEARISMREASIKMPHLFYQSDSYPGSLTCPPILALWVPNMLK
jgi:TRAP-type C4-dicarboxylate transport system permease large subunit